MRVISMCVLLTVLACTTAASAATVQVVPGQSIQAAINAASPGDTIEVAAGTYNESLQIGKSVSVVAPAGPAATILNGNHVGECYYMVAIDADNVLVSGLTITNPIYAGTADASGVVIGMASRPAGVRITNCIIRDLGIAGRNPVSFGTFGVNCGPVNGLEIDHCQIYNIANGDPDAWAVGIFTWGNDSVQTADNIHIHDNVIHDIVSPNAFVNAISVGGASANVVIDNNTISGPVKNGVTTSGYLEPGTVAIDGNTISNASVTGLLLRSPYATTVSGNTISGCATGVQVNDSAAVTPVLHLNSIAGNAVGVSSAASGLVDAERNWWGSNSGPAAGQVVGNVDYDPWLTGWPLNQLSLDPNAGSLYVRFGETVTVDLNVSNLAQMVNGCQALIGYSSAYLSAGTVAPGGGPWTELIYESWAVAGELDTAIGVTLEGPVGTDADGTVATITLTAGTTEGTTRVVFRPDGDQGYETMLSDLGAQPVWPAKSDSVDIVIDNTPPMGATIAADPASWTNSNNVTLTFSASDALAGIDHYELQVDGGAFFAAASPYSLDVSALADGTHAVTVKAVDRAGNEATASTSLYLDKTAPQIAVDSAKQGGVELIGTSVNALQGVVDIYVSASDPTSGLDGEPVVTVTPNGGAAEPAAYLDQAAGVFHYTWTVTVATPNGPATIDASVSDVAGNSQAAAARQFNVNKNQFSGTVSWDTYSTSSFSVTRDVEFVATDSGGAEIKTWTVTATFANNTGTQIATGSYLLTDVPMDTARLSAKTGWTLRIRQAALLNGDGQRVLNFTLPGGDLNGDNYINILDYSILKSQWNSYSAGGDINGDGMVQTRDYSIMKANWFRRGDPR